MNSAQYHANGHPQKWCSAAVTGPLSQGRWGGLPARDIPWPCRTREAAGAGPGTALQTLLILQTPHTPDVQPVPSASHLKPAQVWENCELTKGENKLYIFF